VVEEVMSANDDQNERVSVRLDPEDRAAINLLVVDGDYENVSDFIRKAVKDKLNPKLRKARMRKEMLELAKDPEVRRELGLK